MVCLLTDGFELVLFRIKLFAKMREIKNNVKKTNQLIAEIMKNLAIKINKILEINQDA